MKQVELKLGLEQETRREQVDRRKEWGLEHAVWDHPASSLHLQGYDQILLYLSFLMKRIIPLAEGYCGMYM